MKEIKIKKWWKATEIPLVENDWRNIRRYCDEEHEWWTWNRSVYFVRLSPPFQIKYSEKAKEPYSPIIYIGQGAIADRWKYHRQWISALGYWLPGARYEIWATAHENCKEIESDSLTMFREHYGRLPLANRKSGGSKKVFNYDDTFHLVDKADRRYWWGLVPTQKDLSEYFEKGKAAVQILES
jgi:hypothetical protein